MSIFEPFFDRILKKITINPFLEWRTQLQPQEEDSNRVSEEEAEAVDVVRTFSKLEEPELVSGKLSNPI